MQRLVARLTLLLCCITFTHTNVEAKRGSASPNKVLRDVAPLAPNMTTQHDLGLDRAGVRLSLNITPDDAASWPIFWYISYSYCHNCLPQKILNMTSSGISNYVQLESRWYSEMSLRDVTNNTLASMRYQFGQHGLYTLKVVAVSNGLSVEIIEDAAPEDPHIAIYVAIGIFAGAAIIWVIGTRIWSNYQRNELEKRLTHESREPLMEEAAPAPEQPAPASSNSGKRRLSSLDTFRGLSLAIMIFVNYGGGGYWFLSHSYWNGLTVADLVFPWFIWMMGVSMALSMDSLIKKRTSKFQMTTKIIRRSLILFWLGLFINNGYDTGNWRIPGVLQRFGVSYLVVGLILTYAPRAGPWARDRHLQQASSSSWLSLFDDITQHWVEWLIIASFLLIHTCITFLLEVPGCPTGYIGPGGWADYGKYYHCVGGAAKYIDMKVFGYNQMYHWPTCRDTYDCGEFDPEGLLGCLTSIVITYLGVQSGRILVYYKQHKEILVRWVAWAVALGIITLALTKGGTQNDGVIPVNKNLWSMSFIFALACMANLGLSICYILVDLTGIWNGAPFRYTGMNSIVIYVGSEILDQHFPFAYIPSSDNVHGPLLVCHLVGAGCWLLCGYYMYTINFFVAI